MEAAQRLLAYAALRAAAGRLADLLAAADVVEGEFRAVAEERWGARPGGACRALRTLAEVGYGPGMRRVLEEVARVCRERGVPLSSDRCPLCGARLVPGCEVRHAAEAHADAVWAIATAAAERLGLSLDPGFLRRKVVGGWWAGGAASELLPLVQRVAGSVLAACAGPARTLTVRALVRTARRSEREARRVPVQRLAAAARVFLATAERVVDARGREWVRGELSRGAAVFRLASARG